jgi:hydrogenase maturation protease
LHWPRERKAGILPAGLPLPSDSANHTRVAETNNRILLLGLGNDILTDDAVGLRVARDIRAALGAHPMIEVQETPEMGLALLDFMVGYREVLIVDSIQTGQAAPGTLRELDADGLRNLSGRTPHFLGVGETLALGRHLGLAMPGRVRIFAIEVEDPFTVATEMTPALQRAFPQILARVTEALLEAARQLASSSATAP